jgi:hypothetical protein
MDGLNTLKQLLAEKGVSRSFLDTAEVDMLKGISKAFNIDPTPYLPRDVRLEVSKKTGATYAVVDGYPVPKIKNGKSTGEVGLARGIYVRVEAIDNIIKDLLVAKGMWEKENE